MFRGMRCFAACVLALTGAALLMADGTDARPGESAAAAVRPLAGLLGGSDVDSFRKSVSAISDLQVFEGLPDPKTESVLFAKENARPDVTRYLGFSFYAKPIGLTPAELGELREVFNPGNPFSPGGGQDPCGRFHPDYLLVWKGKADAFYAMIGLGCQEIEAVSPSYRIHHYIPPDAYARLNRLLGRQTANRPRSGP